MELGKLPVDLLTEILVRADVKTVIRSSSVCKAWHRLIVETPYFGDKHLNHWKNKKDGADDAVVFLRFPGADTVDQLVTYDVTNSPPFSYESLELPFQSSDRNLLVRQCNGILCIAEGVKMATVYLCNVATNDHILLPPGLFEDDKVYLTENIGFGFDESSNEYKVVRIKRDRLIKRRQKGLQLPERKRHAEVYKLSTNSWSELDVDFPFKERICGNGVYLNGFCHWWDSANTPSGKMVRFSFKTEAFGEMRFPLSVGGAESAKIDVLGDCLAVVLTMEGGGFEIWTMEEYGKCDSWTKFFAVYGHNFDADSYWYHDSKRVVFMVCSLEKDSMFIVCSFEGRLPRVRYYKYDCYNLRRNFSTVFWPSLVSLRNRLPVP